VSQVALATNLRKSLVDCDVNFLALRDTGYRIPGLLSVSGLGAVSAESCGRDSFAEAAGFRQLGLVCLLRLTTIKPSEIVEGL
jgi:hypothetical protein